MAADQPNHEPPKGCEKYDLGGKADLGALSEQQQEKLNAYKDCRVVREGWWMIKTRKNNEKYLREHPEVECLLSTFLSAVLSDHPDNVNDYAAEFFTDESLPMKIERKLMERIDTIGKNNIIKTL